MPTYVLSPLFNGWQGFNPAGQPLSGGKIYTYSAGTSTPQATYTTSTGAVPNSNPITLDAGGRPPNQVWLTSGSQYKFVLTDSSLSTISTYDNIYGIGDTSTILPVLAASSGATLIGTITPLTSGVARTQQSKNQDTLSVFDFMTTAQIADVKAYGFATDSTSSLQAAINAAVSSGYTLLVPPGGYSISGNLNIPDPAAYGVFKMVGAGISNPFSIGNSDGTQFRQLTAATTLQYNGVGTHPTNLEINISGIGFYSTNAALVSPVVFFEGFYGVCEFHHNVIWQAGTGIGLQINYAVTSHIHDNYFLNRDSTTAVLGAARVGIGFYFGQTFDGALLTLSKNTSRGWLKGYQIGDDGGLRIYNAAIYDCECSTVYNGIYLSNATYKAVVHNTYGEGGDGGTFITDNGVFNTVEDNYSFPGFLTHILSTVDSYGGNYNKNQISLSAAAPSSTPNAIGIDLRGNAGFGRVVSGNTFVFGGSGGAIVGVVGIKVAGASPVLTMQGNAFNPAVFVGGAGTQTILDNSSTTAGSGSGVQGYAQVISTSGRQIPYVAGGSYNVAISGTTLTGANLSAGVLSLTVESDFVMTATSAIAVSSMSAPNIEGKLFWVRTTNANTTFANTANLKLTGSANYTPGANGSSHQFKCNSSICWEVSRIAY